MFCKVQPKIKLKLGLDQLQVNHHPNTFNKSWQSLLVQPKNFLYPRANKVSTLPQIQPSVQTTFVNPLSIEGIKNLESIKQSIKSLKSLFIKQSQQILNDWFIPYFNIETLKKENYHKYNVNHIKTKDIKQFICNLKHYF